MFFYFCALRWQTHDESRARTYRQHKIMPSSGLSGWGIKASVRHFLKVSPIFCSCLWDAWVCSNKSVECEWREMTWVCESPLSFSAASDTGSLTAKPCGKASPWKRVREIQGLGRVTDRSALECGRKRVDRASLGLCLEDRLRGLLPWACPSLCRRQRC